MRPDVIETVNKEISMRLFLSLLLSFMVAFPVALMAGNNDVPSGFKTLEELRSWVYENKGFGEPNSVDFDVSGLRLYVTYFSPGSGSPATRSYAYFMSRKANEWRLVDTHWFGKGGVPSYVYVDNNKNELVFVSFEGKKIRRLSLKEYDYE